MNTNKHNIIEITIPWVVRKRLEKEAEFRGVSLDILINNILRERLGCKEYPLTDNA